MIKMIENDRCCENCRFYFKDANQCRRYPPQVWGDFMSDTNDSYTCNYPIVKKNEWCGEFHPIEVLHLPKSFDSDGKIEKMLKDIKTTFGAGVCYEMPS